MNLFPRERNRKAKEHTSKSTNIFSPKDTQIPREGFPLGFVFFCVKNISFNHMHRTARNLRGEEKWGPEVQSFRQVFLPSEIKPGKGSQGEAPSVCRFQDRLAQRQVPVVLSSMLLKVLPRHVFGGALLEFHLAKTALLGCAFPN